jgi:branched-subunit amino acid aminotransferase/4-amino-4-deoxychorismate lyase
LESTVLLNGEFLPTTAARISVANGGWLHGAGLFETMRAQNRCVFRLDRHLNRLLASAEALQFPLERPHLPVASELSELLERDNLFDARLRLTISAGPMFGEGEAGAGDHPPITACVSAAPFMAYPVELFEVGMTAAICTHRVSTSDPLARHKSTSYFTRLLGLRQARVKGCQEALWFSTDNLLAEGSISNVFLVREGRLLTPSLDGPLLPGIARAVVLEVAGDQQIESVEKPLTIDDLLDADEVFLTNSIMEVMPVCRVERKEIGSGKPGPMTMRLLAAYRAQVGKECEGHGQA